MLYGRESKFFIEEGTKFAGYTTGEKWKYYSCPYFEKEVIEQIFRKNDYIVWGYNSDKDCFIYYFPEEVLKSNQDIPILYGTDIKTVNGIKHVYQLGAGEWLWQEFCTFEKYIVSASTSRFWIDEYAVLETKNWKEAHDWINLQRLNDKCLMITVWSKDKNEEAKVVKKIQREPKLTESKKYYSYNTMFRSVKDLLSTFCKENNIYFEPSGREAGWHFEILCSEEELKMCNDFLDSISITEQRD